MYNAAEAAAFLLFAVLFALVCDAWWQARERRKPGPRYSDSGRGSADLNEVARRVREFSAHQQKRNGR